MLNFDSKTSVQKYHIFCSWYNFFSTNVSDFYCLNLKTLIVNISAKN